MAKNPIVEEIKKVQEMFITKQNSCREVEETLSRYKSLAGESNQLGALQRRKEGIQADIALGHGSQADLDQVNQEIAALLATIGEHEATVAGLSRRLERAQAELSSANYNRLVLVKSYIRNTADQIQAEYIETAKVLLAQFRRLKALGHIYSEGEYSPEPFARGDEHKFLSIPVFQLASSGQWPALPHNMGGEWEPAKDIQRPELYAAADEEAEKARLTALGIEL